MTRRAPFGLVHLADDDVSVAFAAVPQPSEVVTILSTEPLTAAEPWKPLQVGEAILLQGGEVVRRRPGHGEPG